MDDDEASIRATLRDSGLTPTDEDIGPLVVAFRSLREMADRVVALAAAEGESSDLVFVPGEPADHTSPVEVSQDDRPGE